MVIDLNTFPVDGTRPSGVDNQAGVPRLYGRLVEVSVRRLSLLWCFGVFSCWFLATSAGAQKAQHPLDALGTEEYWAAYDAIVASGHFNSDTHFESILLHEPPKSVVLAWKPGDAIPREADVVLLRKERVIEARVDVAARKLESWKEIPGAQGPVFDSEITGMTETILGDERVKKALAKRNITDLNTSCAAGAALQLRRDAGSGTARDETRGYLTTLWPGF